MSTPLDELDFPVFCSYPDCAAEPFNTAIEADEHITECHLPEAVWDFAVEHMKPTARMPELANRPAQSGSEGGE